MKKRTSKLIAILLVAVMLFAATPASAVKKVGEAITTVTAAEKPDYSVTPDYAARYKNGVFEFTQSEIELTEGAQTSFKLIREGGTQGAVTIELKAIDITAKYGVDYFVWVDGIKLILDDEYSGTLTENYLEESDTDYITSEELTTDELYKRIIGYEEEKLDEETTAELYGASVALVADTLKISSDRAQELLGMTEPSETEDNEEEEDDIEKAYTSKLHEQRDAVTGTTSSANHMVGSDILGDKALYGSNEANLAASEIYASTVGAYIQLVFADGENEKEITVVTLNDKAYEPQEIFSLGICNPNYGAEIGDLMCVSVKINDNDPVECSTIGFETASVKVGSDENAAAVDIVRTGCLNDFAVVEVTTKAVTAKEGEDYLPVNTASVFLPGEKKKTVIVPLKTCVYDQTEVKTIGVELSCESAGVTESAPSVIIDVEPRLASEEIVERVVAAGRSSNKENEDEYYYVIPQETIEKWKELSGKNGHVRLFFDDDHEDWYSARVEIDIEYNEDCKTVSYIEDKYDVYLKYYWSYESYSGYSCSDSFSMSRKYSQYLSGSGTLTINKIKKGNDFYYLNMKRNGKYEEYAYWNNVTIKEIRVYPKVFDAYIGNKRHGVLTDNVKAEYRLFNGTKEEDVAQVYSYDAGTVTIESGVYKGWTVGADVVTLNAEGQERGAKLQGFDIDGKAFDYNLEWGGRFGGSLKGKQVGTKLTREDLATLITDDNNILSNVFRLTPIMRGDPVDYITIADYDKSTGTAKIGDKTYWNQKVVSTAWREGDELKMVFEPVHGYLCEKVEITKPDGKIFYAKPGESIRLYKGMIVKPVFVSENITATVRWDRLLPGLESENKDTNLSHDYAITSATPFEYAKDSSGNEDKTTLIFKNLAHDDTITLYAVPTKQTDKKYTGMWLREKVTDTEKSLGDDTRFFCCVGDGYTFTIDNHDMVIDYYFAEIGNNANGTVIKGKVFSPGGSVKARNNTELTAGNVEAEGFPVNNASVTVLSIDPNAQYNNGTTTYYTSTYTDKEGRFAVYLPTGAKGYGYCISINDCGREYNYISAYSANGEVAFILPFQSSNYQVVDMTLGQDHDTTEIALTDTEVTFGIKIAVAEGYHAQGLIFRSYDRDGALKKQWEAGIGEYGWDYESTFIPSAYLDGGGRVTAEIVGMDGIGQGEVDTGYTIYKQPDTSTFKIPQFDPKAATTLPIFGQYTATIRFGEASNVKPQTVGPDTGSLEGGGKNDKKPLVIALGSVSALKNAVKLAKQNPKYATADAAGRASLIVGNMNNKDYDNTDRRHDAEDEDGYYPGLPADTNIGRTMDSSLSYDYKVGVYMSLYTKGNACYFDDLVIYAAASVKGTHTQCYYIAGFPIYIQFGGQLGVEFLFHVDNENPDEYIIEAQNGGYFNSNMLEDLQSAGVFKMNIGIRLGVGLGNPKFISVGISGMMSFDIDYRPWDQGAGTVVLMVNADLRLFMLGISYTLATAKYGLFRTENYDGDLSFNGIKNIEDFPELNQKKALRSYDDGESLTELYGEIVSGRGNSIMSQDPMSPPHNVGMHTSYGNIIASKVLEGATANVDPILLPIGNGEKALYLRLDDDATRGDNDYSSVVYSLIDYDGHESTPCYLDNDGTADGDVTACEIGDGRVLVVWSDLTETLGSGEVDFGNSLNKADLSYCIFDSNGTPGEVRKLTDSYGAEKMPTIAYDKETGNTAVVYLSTDYETEGVSFGKDNLEDFGNFVYNSYTTVCFKLLDENGDVITDYTEAESNYSAYESINGTLGGLRYLNIDTKTTVDEMSAAARNGVLYVVYSLDTDSNVATDNDRELFVTRVDLISMEQGDPEKLTDNAIIDKNPQIVDFNDGLQLYWNNGGVIKLVNLEKYYEYKATETLPDWINEINDCAETIVKSKNAAYSFYVRSYYGKLDIVWSGIKETEDGTRVALFCKEYDPEYRRPVIDEEGTVSYDIGSWGNTQSLAVFGENDDCAEFAFIDKGDRSIVCYNVSKSDENSKIYAHDVHLLTLGEATTLDIKTVFTPRFPLAGDNTTLEVTLTNTGSLPSEKVSVMVDLIDKLGNATAIGNDAITEHYQSNGEIKLSYDLVVPENFEDYIIRVVAWENDLQSSAKIEKVKFPYESVVSLENVGLERSGDGYLLTFNVINEGNKDFEGMIALDYVAAGLAIFTDDEAFTPVLDYIPVSVADKSSARKVVFFDVAEDKLNEKDDSCEIYLAVEDEEGSALDSRSFYVRKYYSELPAVTGINFDGSAEIPSLELVAGDEASLNALIMPYKARNGYHLEYSIDNESVACVDDNGNVTALKGGTANVTVTVVKDSVAMVVNTNNRSSVSANEQGIVEFDVAEEKVVMTKTVSLTVIGDPDPVHLEWKKSKGNLDLETDIALDNVVTVKVDGAIVASKNNIVNASQGTVTLKADYLKKLTFGTHKVEIENDKVTAAFYINVKKEVTVSGGCGADVTGSAAVFGITALVLVAFVAMKKRKD